MAHCYCDMEYRYQQNLGQKLDSHCSFPSQLFDYFSIRFIWSSALESLPEKEGLENNWDNPKLLLTTQLLEGTQTVPKSSQGQGQGLCHHFDEEEGRKQCSDEAEEPHFYLLTKKLMVASGQNHELSSTATPHRNLPFFLLPECFHLVITPTQVEKIKSSLSSLTFQHFQF